MGIFKLNQQGSSHQAGLIQLIPLLLLLVGIIAGVYFLQKEGFQIFKSKASAKSVEILDGDCVNTKSGGTKVLTCDRFQFKVTSPLEGAN